VSRLYNPYASLGGGPLPGGPLDSFLAGNPFAGLPGAIREPTVGQLLPTVSPEDEQSTVGGIMEQGLGGLAYLGKLADKTFGGRAVRGVLGGRPEEALSLIPLSDTMDITKEENVVSGRDLLRGAGLVDAGDPTALDTGDVAGFAAEVLLDPSTYLGIGPLTRAGTLAKKAGNLPSGYAARAGGFAAKQSELEPLARAGGREVSDLLADFGLSRSSPVLSREAEASMAAAGQPVETLLGLDPAGQVVKARDKATPLAGLVGLGLPFSRPSVVLGEGKTLGLGSIPGVARGLRAAQPVIDPIKRTLGGLFDPAAQGTYDARAQELARDIITPREKEREAGALAEWVTQLDKLKPYLGKGPDADRAALRTVTAQAEQVGQNAALPLTGAGIAQKYGQKLDAEAARYFQPHEIAELQKIGDDGYQLLQQVRREAADLGVNEPELLDSYIEYFIRQKTVLEKKPGEGVFGARNRKAREYSAEHASQIRRMKVFRELPGGTAQLNDLAKDPRLSGAGRNIGGTATTDAQAELILLDELAGVTDPKLATPELRSQAKRLGKFLKGLEETYAKDGVDYFSLDVPTNILARVQRADRAKTAAEAVYEGVVRFGKDKAAIEAAGDQAVPVKEVLEMFNLTGKSAAGGRIAPKKIADRLGTLTPGRVVADLHVPKGMVDDLRKVHEAWENPRALAPVVQAWDWATNLFKGFVTAPFVAFHARNLGTGLFNMWRGGVYGSPQELARSGGEMFSLLRGEALKAPLPGMAAGADATQEFLKEVISNRVAFMPGLSNTADIVGPAGTATVRRPDVPVKTGRTLLEEGKEFAKGLVPKTKAEANPLNVQGVQRDEDVFTVMKQARAAGQKIEDWLRLTHYYGLRQQGWAPKAAAAEVHKYQIDYRNLSPFEKNVAKRVYPWYAFSRRNLPPLLEDLAEQPAKITAALRATSGVREHGEFLPGYVAEGASLPITGAPEGQQRYVTSFGLPFEDEGIKALGSLAQGNVQRAAQQALGMTQPFLKGPFEFTFNKQLYSGRPLEDLRPYEHANLGGLLDDRQARVLTQLVANTPLSRFASTANRLTDERKDFGTQLVNLLTGVRVSDVDVERARDAATKEVVGNMLRGQPGFKTTSDVYVPKDKIPGADPRDLLLYRLYLNADQRLRDQAAARRTAGPSTPR
jgi:hypothetical protein